jgi:hypothetical protein
MTGNTVKAAVVSDIRNLLDTTADTVLLMDWVDRIQKDLIYNSVYRVFGQATVAGDWTAGGASYSPSYTNLRRILAVVDLVVGRTLTPWNLLATPNAIPGELSAGNARTPGVPGRPEGFYVDSVGALTVAPPPSTATASSTGFKVIYEKTLATVTDPTATLTLPDDALFPMVAGVNMLAFIYLGRQVEAQAWAGIYENYKAGVKAGGA